MPIKFKPAKATGAGSARTPEGTPARPEGDWRQF
jgi:hypothetical protein